MEGRTDLGDIYSGELRKQMSAAPELDPRNDQRSPYDEFNDRLEWSREKWRQRKSGWGKTPREIAVFVATLLTLGAVLVASYLAYMTLVSDHERMVVEMRPYLTIADGWPQFATTDDAVPKITNTGRTPALNVRWCSVMQILPLDEHVRFVTSITDRRCVRHDIPLIASQSFAERRAWIQDARTPTQRAQLAPDDRSHVNDGRKWVALHGRLEFCDVFNVPHRIDYCFFRTDADVMRLVHELGDSPQRECVKHEGMDTNTKDGSPCDQETR